MVDKPSRSGAHGGRTTCFTLFVPDPATGSGTDTGRPSADAYRLGFPTGRAAGRRAWRGAMAVRPCRNTGARGISIALALTAFLTGALHEDGLADLADGFGGGERKSGKSRSCGIAVSALWSTGRCYLHRYQGRMPCQSRHRRAVARCGWPHGSTYPGAHGDPANRLLPRPRDRHRAGSGAGRAKP